MTENLSNYSAKGWKQIEKAARRNIQSECRLILTAGFSVIMVVSFFLNEWTFLPISMAFGIRPIAVWIVMSFGLAALWAVLHRLWFKGRIEKAQALHAEKLHQYQEARRSELEAKYQSKS